MAERYNEIENYSILNTLKNKSLVNKLEIRKNKGLEDICEGILTCIENLSLEETKMLIIDLKKEF